MADRWHILKNLGEAVKRVLTRQCAQIEQAVIHLRAQQLGQSADAGLLAVPSLVSSSLLARPQTEVAQPRAQRYARSCAVKQLQEQGISQVAIARTLGMNRSTVQRFMQAATFPERVRYWMGSRLDPYLPYLHKRWTEGVHNPLPLWREIRARGYPGAARMLARYVLRLSHRLRGLSPQQRANFLRGALTFPMPSIRRVTGWGQRSARALTTKQRQFLTPLERVSPEVKETRVLVRSFRHLMNHRQVSQFPRWLTQAEQSAVPELRSFAVGLRQEYASIAAAIEYSWSNGPVEGHVNRLKTIKRQMYGRANFDLLKARVLSTSAERHTV